MNSFTGILGARWAWPGDISRGRAEGEGEGRGDEERAEGVLPLVLAPLPAAICLSANVPSTTA